MAMPMTNTAVAVADAVAVGAPRARRHTSVGARASGVSKDPRTLPGTQGPSAGKLLQGSAARTGLEGRNRTWDWGWTEDYGEALLLLLLFQQHPLVLLVFLLHFVRVAAAALVAHIVVAVFRPPLVSPFSLPTRQH